MRDPHGRLRGREAGSLISKAHQVRPDLPLSEAADLALDGELKTQLDELTAEYRCGESARSALNF